ncbi:MFS transporter [Kosmotoga pacifica]|uniref:MFS transporter n=1 Tax=Kosmotoga pacifica TaxID=1330330 RepID=A0A0G2ZFX5_9BACT|nr:MFS transporter [Kosmotoga pacifica]AKI97723.1 MFS transporter [Kosmotoga pacifica]
MEERRHFFAFIWHASFLALTMAFVEVNTVLPALVLKAGGNSFSIGLITAITTGIPLLVQIIFAGLLMARTRKKPFLLLGIYLRVFSLASIGFLLRSDMTGSLLLLMIFLIISIFSFSGVFAGICYTDLLGKSIAKNRRKFMAFRQIVGSFLSLVGGYLARMVVSKIPYPNNYSMMFFIAAFSLALGSIGFWMIREESSEITSYPGFWKIIKSIPATLKGDSNLRGYILFTNMTGFGLILIPFYVLLAKETFGLTGENVGNFLFLQMIGMLIAGFFWGNYLHRKGFKKLLYLCAIFGSTLPILALLLSKTNANLYMLIFLLTGITLSARKMGFEGLLIEISNNENRALYTGISGAFNLVTALLPLVMGMIIDSLGFAVVFVFSSVFIFSGILYLNRIKIQEV